MQVFTIEAFQIFLSKYKVNDYLSCWLCCAPDQDKLLALFSVLRLLFRCCRLVQLPEVVRRPLDSAHSCPHLPQEPSLYSSRNFFSPFDYHIRNVPIIECYQLGNNLFNLRQSMWWPYLAFPIAAWVLYFLPIGVFFVKTGLILEQPIWEIELSLLHSSPQRSNFSRRQRECSILICFSYFSKDFAALCLMQTWPQHGTEARRLQAHHVLKQAVQVQPRLSLRSAGKDLKKIRTSSLRA